MVKRDGYEFFDDIFGPLHACFSKIRASVSAGCRGRARGRRVRCTTRRRRRHRRQRRSKVRPCALWGGALCCGRRCGGRPQMLGARPAMPAGEINAGRVRKKGGAWRDCAPRPETRPPPACPWMIGGWRVRGVLGWVKHRPDCVRRGGIGAEMRPELFGPGPHSGVGPTARHVATWPRTQRSGDGGRCPASARPPCGAG